MPDEDFKKEFHTEIKTVIDLAARVDERVKSIYEKQAELSQRFNAFIESHQHLAAKVSVLESKNGNVVEELKNKQDAVIERIAKAEIIPQIINEKIENIHESINKNQSSLEKIIKTIANTIHRIDKLEECNNSTWNRITFIFDYVTRGLWVIVLAYVLYRMGIQSPPG